MKDQQRTTSELSADEIIGLLDLRPHPEGGLFAETYRAGESISADGLPERYSGDRSFSTAIYYFLTPETFSALHRVKSDEVFHFYLGDPIEMLQLLPDGSGGVVLLGTDLAAGMRPQVVVPHGVWQGCRLREGGKLALVGATVAPGFEYADFELGQREPLSREYRRLAPQIAALTRS